VLNAANRPGIIVAVVVLAGLVAGFALAQLSGSRPAGGIVLVLAGAAAAVLMWRAGSRWGVLVTGLAYAIAFALSHPLAALTTAWPAAMISGLAAAAVAYAATPESPRPAA
jgi:hypothetical protein